MRCATDDGLTWLGRIVVSVLATWALAFILPDCIRVVRAMPTLGFTVDDAGVVRGKPEPFALRAGVREGDRLDLRVVRCGPRATTEGCSSAIALFSGMGGYQYVAPREYRFAFCSQACGKGPDRTVSVTPEPLALPLPVRVLLLLDEILGVAFVVLATALVWQCPSAMTWGFLLYALYFNPGQTYTAYALLQPWPPLVFVQEAFQALAEGAGMAGFILFALRFPRNARTAAGARIEPWLVPLAVIGSLWNAVTFSTPLDLFGPATNEVMGVFENVWVVFGALVDVAVLAILVVRLRQTRAGRAAADSIRVQWVLWSMILGLPPALLAEYLATSPPFGMAQTTGEGIVYALFLFNGIVPLAVYHVVRRERVVDVRFGLTRPLLRGVFGLAIVVAVTMVMHLIDEPVTSGLFGAGALIVVGLLLDKFREPLETLFDRIAFSSLRQCEKRFRESGAELMRKPTVEKLHTSVAQRPATILGLASSAFFYDPRGRAYRLCAQIGWDDQTPAFPPDDPLLADAIARRSPHRFLAAPQSSGEIPTGMGTPALALPMIVAGSVTGVLVVGAHERGMDVNADEEELLVCFLASASAAYERIEMSTLRDEVARLQKQLEGLGVAGTLRLAES